MMGDATYNHVFSNTDPGELTMRLAAGDLSGTGDLLGEGGAASDQLLGGFQVDEEDAATPGGENALDALLGAMMDNMDPRAPAIDAQDTPTGTAKKARAFQSQRTL